MSDRIFKPSEAYKLEDPERLKWLPPDTVIEALSLRPGTTVADIGAGTGYFAIPMARAVGEGTVWAVDSQQEMLALLRDKLQRSGASTNIRCVHGRATATTLPDHCCGLVLLANVWHELEDHDSVLREVARILKPGGRIAILDWRPDMPPPPGPPTDHRITATCTREMLEAQHWTVGTSVNIGEYSYLVLAQTKVQT